LEQVTLLDNVNQIGNEAFVGNADLVSLKIGKGIQSIGYDAFRLCNNELAITCIASYPPSISVLGITRDTRVYVPKDYVKTYKKSSYWEKYSHNIRRLKE
jgi:hypothetical protein